MTAQQTCRGNNMQITHNAVAFFLEQEVNVFTLRTHSRLGPFAFEAFSNAPFERGD
jgi:hypothetical protein